MWNIQTINTFIGQIPVRAMQLESLGWAACVYTSAEGRKGDYVFGETQAEVIANLAAELEG